LSDNVILCDKKDFSKRLKDYILITLISAKSNILEDRKMNEKDLQRVLEENKKLKEDNEMLLNIIAQMRVTLNRLVNRYIVEQPVD